MAEAPWQPTNATDDPVVQLLDPSGEPTTDPRWQRYRDLVADLDLETLRDFYRDMVITRRFDDEATSLQRQGELALFAQAKGQEAAQIGSARALAPQDYAFPSYREHGVGRVRGLDLRQALRLFRGVDYGGLDTAEHNLHLNTLVIDSHALHAMG